MTVDEYIKRNWDADRLRDYSFDSAWHRTIVAIVREVWEAAQQAAAPDAASDEPFPKCDACGEVWVDHVCPPGSPRR